MIKKGEMALYSIVTEAKKQHPSRSRSTLCVE